MPSMLGRQVGPPDTESRYATWVRRRRHGHLDVVVRAGEVDTPEHRRTPAGDDGGRQQKAGSPSPELVVDRDIAVDVDVTKQRPPGGAVELSPGEQATAHRRRAPEDLAAQLVRNLGGAHHRTVPQATLSTRWLSTGAAIVR